MIAPPRAAEMFKVLNEHGVAYVVIGGMAAEYHGSELGTEDVDITPNRATENLERLSDALRELDAKFLDPGGRVVEDVDMPWDAALLERMGSVRTFTKFGILDLVFRPDGTDGYEDLVRRATYVVVRDVAAPVAALADVIRSKEAAGRPKDLATLAALETLAARLRALRLRPDTARIPVDPARFVGDS